jgi:DNA-directed RNA polymerase specialized sigma24 family protein
MTTRQSDQWTMTVERFDRLLLLLDPDRISAAERYEEIRTRLIKFFEWRGCSIAGELADRTFDRVAAKIEQGEEIRNITAYCVGVARLVHLESLREVERQRQLFDETPEAAVTYDFEAAATEFARMAAFEDCFAALMPDQRGQLTTYHTGEKAERIANRKGLAKQLGIAAGSLRIRMFRLRQILEECLDRSLKK